MLPTRSLTDCMIKSRTRSFRRRFLLSSCKSASRRFRITRPNCQIAQSVTRMIRIAIHPVSFPKRYPTGKSVTARVRGQRLLIRRRTRFCSAFLELRIDLLRTQSTLPRRRSIPQKPSSGFPHLQVLGTNLLAMQMALPAKLNACEEQQKIPREEHLRGKTKQRKEKRMREFLTRHLFADIDQLRR